MTKRKPAREPERSPLLTFGEVAEMLRVDVRTVRTWAGEGRLTRVRLGSHSVRVTRASVEAMIEAGTE